MEKTNTPNSNTISRRQFLITSGGFALLVTSGTMTSQYLLGKDKSSTTNNTEDNPENKTLNVWVQLDKDG